MLRFRRVADPFRIAARKIWFQPTTASSWRARLRKAALAVMQGEMPDGLDPATHAVRSAAIVLPEEANFYQAAADALVVREGIAHASV